MNNIVQTGATSAAIAGGDNHLIETNAIGFVISGGFQNSIQVRTNTANIAGYNPTSGGGLWNIIGSPYAVIGGGYNTIAPDSNTGVIKSGFTNSIYGHSWNVTNSGGSYHSIGTIYADGVVLAAIEGLNQKLAEEVQAKNTRISLREYRSASLENRLAILETLVADMTADSSRRSP